MVLVNRLAVQDRLNRCSTIIVAGLVVTAGEFRRVPILAHIEVQPLVVVKPLRRTQTPGGVKGHQVEPAVAEFQLALDELRQKDEKSLVVLYDSKALAEFSVATLLEGAGQTQQAKEAYGRALQEDLAYYPAHMRLGLLAMSQGDTTAALSELAMAAEIATNDPFVHYMNGWVLGKAKHTTEAIAELTKATELEPYYALPNLILGAQYEALEKAPEALAAYDRFLKTTSASDPQRQFATDRIEDLKAFLNAPKTQ